MLRTTLDQAYDGLAERIVEAIFLSVPMELRPIYPTAAYPGVNSLRPGLRWEPFPGPSDLRAEGESWRSRIGNVTYDLEIWWLDDRRGDSGKLSYSRNGLPEPWHNVESPLQPETAYLWRIRARFDLDGESRMTQWWGDTHSWHPRANHWWLRTPARDAAVQEVIQVEPVTEPLRQGVIVYQSEALAGVAYKVTDQIVATACKRKPWSQPATREDATEQLKLKATALGANGLMDVWCGNSTGILGSPQDCWGAITCTATAIQVTR